ncbi:MAG: DUF5103 domain-containing protein [Bacteroidaceae bacterium]|nr:DUF5103 domain-containing protein [Bacteroidaceae bacterium]
MRPAALLLLLLPLTLCAQRTVVYSPDVATVTLSVDGDDARLPVLTLGGTDRLTVEFDDLTPEYRRYTWRVEHCDPDWRTTDGLFDSEFMALPPDGDPIDDYTPSSLTATLYTHYRFSLPGRGGTARPLLSGNYRISVFADGDDESPAFTCCFAVVDNRCALGATVSGDTDIDYRAAHQQLTASADVSALRLTDPAQEARLVVVQNRCPLFSAVPSPTSQTATRLLWEHCRALIFPGGNEYRKFEMPSTRIPGMHVDRLRYNADEVLYCAWLLPDRPRRGYFYDEDQNGRALVLADEAATPATEADYVLTRFTLEADEIAGADVYVDGRWTEPTDAYRMAYNPEAGAYEADILLKQGYYSYRYLAVERATGRTVVYNPDGDHYQTDNEYTLLLYYRPLGARYWQLVGLNDFRVAPN